jgi:hypothetical protein
MSNAWRLQVIDKSMRDCPDPIDDTRHAKDVPAYLVGLSDTDFMVAWLPIVSELVASDCPTRWILASLSVVRDRLSAARVVGKPSGASVQCDEMARMVQEVIRLLETEGVADLTAVCDSKKKRFRLAALLAQHERIYLWKSQSLPTLVFPLESSTHRTTKSG